MSSCLSLVLACRRSRGSGAPSAVPKAQAQVSSQTQSVWRIESRWLSKSATRADCIETSQRQDKIIKVSFYRWDGGGAGMQVRHGCSAVRCLKPYPQASVPDEKRARVRLGACYEVSAKVRWGWAGIAAPSAAIKRPGVRTVLRSVKFYTIFVIWSPGLMMALTPGPSNKGQSRRLPVAWSTGRPHRKGRRVVSGH